MAESGIEQDAQIASKTAAKMVSSEAVTIAQLQDLRNRIDEKRKHYARPLRLQIKEVDQLFAPALNKISEKMKELYQAKHQR